MGEVGLLYWLKGWSHIDTATSWVKYPKQSESNYSKVCNLATNFGSMMCSCCYTVRTWWCLTFSWIHSIWKRFTTYAIDWRCHGSPQALGGMLGSNLPQSCSPSTLLVLLDDLLWRTSGATRICVEHCTWCYRKIWPMETIEELNAWMFINALSLFRRRFTEPRQRQETQIDPLTRLLQYFVPSILLGTTLSVIVTRKLGDSSLCNRRKMAFLMDGKRCWR